MRVQLRFWLWLWTDCFFCSRKTLTSFSWSEDPFSLPVKTLLVYYVGVSESFLLFHSDQIRFGFHRSSCKKANWPNVKWIVLEWFYLRGKKRNNSIQCEKQLYCIVNGVGRIGLGVYIFGGGFNVDIYILGGGGGSSGDWMRVPQRFYILVL